MKQHLDLLYDAFQSEATQVASLTELTKRLQEQIVMLQRDPSVAAEGSDQRTFTVTWTIENWRETLEVAKGEDGMKLESMPYYMGHPGFKVGIYAYPNGFRESIGTHLSIYFKVMRGRYDDSLTWPFSHVVRISLIDQRPGGRNVEHSLDPGAEELLQDVSEHYRKPTSDSMGGVSSSVIVTSAADTTLETTELSLNLMSLGCD